MSDPKNPSLWGVQGLNEAEQRQVRGGASGRANCIRGHIQNYASNRRNGFSSRGSLLSQLRADLANCTGSGSGSGSQPL